jgi:hypothetical protein
MGKKEGMLLKIFRWTMNDLSLMMQMQLQMPMGGQDDRCVISGKSDMCEMTFYD